VVRPAKAKLLGSEVPRIFTPPLRELTRETTRGFECIEFALNVLGIGLLPWQKWLLIHALELNEDGTFRFRTVVLLVARQNGKSTVMQVLALWRMYLDGAKLTIGTAQNLDVAEEQWRGAVELAEGVDELQDEIARIDKTNGKKALELHTGERYKVQAANRRGGRGLSGDLVILDELREHSSWDAWAAVSKTTLARAYSQVWAASNAGDAASIVLRFLRKLAHLALGNPDGLDEIGEAVPAVVLEADEDMDDADSLGLFEWSATPGCSLWDRNEWANSNPSMNHVMGDGNGITERAIASSIRTDPEPVARTEVLCQWIDTLADGPFPDGTWEAACDPESTIVGDYAFCVDLSWDRSTVNVGIAGRRPDGAMHIEVVATMPPQFLEAWFNDERTDKGLPRRADDTNLLGVTLQANGAPISSMLDVLQSVKGLTVIPWQGMDLGRWTGKLYDAVCGLASRDGMDDFTPGEPLVYHLGQPVLNAAAQFATTKPLGDSWVWDRAKSIVDIASLVAVTGAYGAFVSQEIAPAKAEPRIRMIGG
jgi:hypothetical protein